RAIFGDGWQRCLNLGPYVQSAATELSNLRAAVAKTRLNLSGLSKSDDDIYAAMVRRLDSASADRADGSDDEGDLDPAGAGLLKPRGNDGIVNAEICFNALLLMGDVDISEERVATWTPDDLAVAYDWAMRRHLAASDNDDVIVPPRPAFIPVAKFGGF
ncbi:hypothetical protein, partial [Pseudomonas fluorescens]|uniref:hypothetical protein n=1 Tax=Pseudomonas fluorescens TaxID=294 RepID=UPI001CA70DF5